MQPMIWNLTEDVCTTCEVHLSGHYWATGMCLERERERESLISSSVWQDNQNDLFPSQTTNQTSGESVAETLKIKSKKNEQMSIFLSPFDFPF